MAQLLAGEKIVLSDGSKVQAEEYLKDKVIALYFSAGWCAQCRAFTPKLKKFYEEIKKAGKNFEVVFVSRDRSASDLVEYYRDHHGAWVYLEFGNPKIQKLLEDFKVETIPTCKVINPDGTVVVDDATNEVQGSEDALVLWEEWLSFSVFGSCEDLSNGVHPLTAQGVGRVLNLSPAAVDWLQSLIPCDTDPILVLNYNDSFFNSQWQYFDQRWQTNPTGEEKKAFVRSTLVGLGGISVEAATYLIKFDDWDTLYAARRAMQVAVPWLFHHPNAQIAQRNHISTEPKILSKVITFYSERTGRLLINPIDFFEF